MANGELRILHNKCVASVHGYPSKVFLVTAEGDFKQHFYNHRMPFNNEGHSTNTTLSKYVRDVKRKLKIMPSLKWYIINLYQPIQIFPRNVSCVCKKNLKFLITPTRMNCFIKDQSLFQSTATLISFYCLIMSLTIRPSGKCPIINI